ncbi:SMI1/KNR4 family protein [Actinoplanes sp. CA-142083]|uniref:SMI1/KNR4 family protein n=1 Tax=Actinoplanes sp. CA-142083 TaxID=3239903 RepID=UPI003D89DBA5
MVDEVEGLWRTIVDWLRSHAPATAAHIRPPASGEALSSLAAALGRTLPADLHRWWQLADGMTVGVLDPLIPSLYTPLPVAEALKNRQFSLSLDQESTDADEVAGAPSYGFHPLFVPIAEDHCGQTMFIDLREGSQHGCIGVWDHESAWDDGVYWESLSDMLTDVRDALVHGRPALVAHAERRLQHFAGHAVDASIWRAAVDSAGRLAWTPQEVGSRR